MTDPGNQNRKVGDSYKKRTHSRRKDGKIPESCQEFSDKDSNRNPTSQRSKKQWPSDTEQASSSGCQSNAYRHPRLKTASDSDSKRWNSVAHTDKHKGKRFPNARNETYARSKGKTQSKSLKRDEGKSTKSPTASTTSNCGENDELDIPGFFYDKEKKRYFKIAPNHSANNYTRDAIARKEAETKRQKDIEQILQGKEKSNVVKQVLHTSNVTALVQDRLINSPNCQLLKTRMCRTTVCNLKPIESQHLFDTNHLGMYENLEHMNMLLTGKNHDELLGLWSLKETWIQRIQMVNLLERKRISERKSLSLSAQVHQKVIIQSLNKVTDLCWAPMPNDRKHILYTTICHTGYLYSLAMIRSLDADEDSGPATFLDYNIGKKATWTCAWNVHKQQFSVGSEKCGLILNVERRTLWEYNTNNSDPLAQIFSHETGNNLHMGTRKGHILSYDMRSRSTFPISTLHHKSSVCGLNLLKNDVSLIATDFSGKVCLWDLRKRDVVVEYMGNVNKYTKLPVHVDEMEKIVYTVGEDGYTRFWCLQQGTLLHTIPPPCSVSRDTIPSVQLSMRWGDRQGNAGLIMGLENKLHYYGTLPAV